MKALLFSRLNRLIAAGGLVLFAVGSGCGEEPLAGTGAALEVGEVLSGLSGTFPGYVATSASADVERCAVSPLSDLSSAIQRDPSYILAYKSGRSSCGLSGGTNHTGEYIHRQGVQRFHLASTNADYLLVSYSVNRNNAKGIKAGFEVVHMDSRSTGGNGLLSGGVTPSTPPACSDRLVANPQESNWDRNHAGGIDQNGQYLAVSVEDDRDGFTAGFRIANLANPASPTWSPLIPRTQGQTKNAGAVALTRLSDGRFLAMVFGNDSDDVEVFVSTTTALCLSTSCWQSKWSEGTPFGSASYQNLQFITGCDGALYLVGTHRNGSGEDWADLWQATLDVNTFNPTLTKKANFHAVCSSGNTGGTRYCDFKAGAGAYVDSAGRVYLYGVEHYDDAFPNDGHGVKVREFKP
jgi:hypothetical protein